MRVHWLHCLFWATLYCVLYLVTASEDDLLDFDFSDPKETNWKLPATEFDLASDVNAAASIEAKKKLDANMLDFSVDIENDDAQSRIPQFDWREKVLRNALAKALTDKALRQKFAEVMPILRVLSAQQRLALSALISAQMNAKRGNELRLEQVRMMFGDDKKLLLPIVYDLANLVKNSARKYIKFGNDVPVAALQQEAVTGLERRKFDLTADELQADDDVGTIRVDDVDNKQSRAEAEDELQDFFVDMSEEFLDPQKINEELMAGTNKTEEQHLRRRRRAAQEFVHKLMRAVPLSVNEEDIMRGAAGRTIKLNTTAFLQPKESTQQTQATSQATTAPSTLAQTELPATEHTTVSSGEGQAYMDIEDLAFASLNGTEVELNASARSDILRPDEPLPSPEELIAGPRYRLNGGSKISGMRGGPIKRKRMPPRTRAKIGAPPLIASGGNGPAVSPPKNCERFTSSMCIRTDDYPFEQIMGSIRRHKNAMTALLAEYYDKPNNNLELGDDFDDFVINNKRREDEGTAGGMCQSVVKYARPQKARSASGEWKYIVNTGQHTQTLRLEKCSNAGESCSYLAQTFRSHCSQVYNYHRLLSWDKLRGLHVDIFKVPTCCSCQVDGYRQQFPPLGSLQSKDFSPANYNIDNGGYSTINEDDLDYNDESDEDEFNFSHFNDAGNSIGHQHPKQETHFNENELFSSSKKVRTKVKAPPTVGPYLSPPDDLYRDTDYTAYKSHRGSGSGSGSASTVSSTSSTYKKHYSNLKRRRPHNEARVDLDLSPSEHHTDKEVNIFGTQLAGDKPRVPHKRKRIYSAPHTANGHIPATYATSTAASATNAHQAGVSQQSQPQQPQQQHTAATTGLSASSPSVIGGGGGQYINLLGPLGATKSRPRFYAHATSATTGISSSSSAGSATSSSSAATSTSTESIRQRTTQQQQQSTTVPPPIYHVNSIYSGSNYNGTASHAGAKRINYNYHPIIDFFDKSKRSEVTDIEQTTSGEQSRIYPHSIPSSSKSPAAGGGVSGGSLYRPQPTARRIGYGAGGSGLIDHGGGAHSGHAQLPFGNNDNAWHPLVVA